MDELTIKPGQVRQSLTCTDVLSLRLVEEREDTEVLLPDDVLRLDLHSVLPAPEPLVAILCLPQLHTSFASTVSSCPVPARLALLQELENWCVAIALPFQQQVFLIEGPALLFQRKCLTKSQARTSSDTAF